jgi:predicted nucleic acid-binding protein
VPATIADAGFLVALLDRRDGHHAWATSRAERHPRPWYSCEAALAEAFYLLEPNVAPLVSLLRRGEAVAAFEFSPNVEPVLTLMTKYADVPMSLADACIVRMTELLPEPVVLTTDSDFKIYRRHGRQVVPCETPY